MILGTVVQQPADNIDYDIDCTSLFNGDSDTLSGVVVSVEPAGLTVTAAVADPNTAKVWIGGGTDKVRYIVTVVVTTTGGRIKEDEIEVEIEEFE